MVLIMPVIASMILSMVTNMVAAIRHAPRHGCVHDLLRATCSRSCLLRWSVNCKGVQIMVQWARQTSRDALYQDYGSMLAHTTSETRRTCAHDAHPATAWRIKQPRPTLLVPPILNWWRNGNFEFTRAWFNKMNTAQKNTINFEGSLNAQIKICLHPNIHICIFSN